VISNATSTRYFTSASPGAETKNAALSKPSSPAREFLLEFRKGFCFVARQKRITLDGDHFFVDLFLCGRLPLSADALHDSPGSSTVIV
jgi:hypothetical protein